MTELDHSRVQTIQHGDYVAEYSPYTDLAPGTEMIIRPELLDSDISKLRARGVNAHIDQVEEKGASRVFLTGDYAEQAKLATLDDGSLSPVGITRILKILSSEDEE